MNRVFYRTIIYISLFVLSLFVVNTCSTSIPREEPILLYETNELSNKPIYHCNLPVLYMINENVPEDVRKIIIRSFSYWDDLTDKDLFSYFGVTNFIANDPRSGTIIIVDIENEKTGIHKDANVLAYVRLQEYRTGCIYRGGIEIYKDTLKMSNRKLESIVRHEIGHILGFGHSLYSEDLMYVSISFLDGLKDLSDWELEAFKIYYDNE